ncbi:ATP-binding protein [uncultured Cohaesibacter sp.]|uniref:ATP-binding protein n=1 Tax=uncultured Cohaesibacter sp. TaxID=1002546 RepID=UPI0029C82B70|nr:ATP-binding protein [uncultured Cohaesibacter sp.]
MASFHPDSLANPFLTLSAHPTIGAVLLDSRPAWVWNADGNRILWANAAGLAFFGEESMDVLLSRSFGDVHPARRHLARLARNARPDSPTLDTLRFFLGLSFVTLSCLCKKLKVEGETVLLVLSSEPLAEIRIPGQEQGWPTIVDPSATLLDSLSCEGALHSALIGADGAVTAASEGFIPFGQNAIALEKLLSKVADENRFAEGSLPFFDSQTGAALARICDEPEPCFLLLVQNPAKLTEAVPLPASSSPFADLEADNQAQIEKELAEAEADIFEDTFGFDELSEIKEKLIKGPDRLKDRDFQPFSMNEGQPCPPSPLSSVPDPFTGQDLSQDLPDGETQQAATGAAPSQDGQSSNIYRLQFPKRRSGPLDMALLGSETKGANAEGQYHFVWESDAIGRFKHISEELAKTVGPNMADIVGLTWEEVAEKFGLDEDRTIASSFDSRDTWASLDVWWPVEGEPHRIAVELTGLPIYGHLHGFQGYRGFGLCKPHQRQALSQSAQDGAKALADIGSHLTSHKPPQTTSQAAEGRDDSPRGQLAQIEELISADLLRAAQDAVATTTELISPEDASEAGQSPAATEETSGVIAVCDDSEKGTEDLNNHSDEQHRDDVPEAEASDAEHASKATDAPDVSGGSEAKVSQYGYSLVGSLLSGSAKGVREVLEAVHLATQKDASRLSSGEEHAFHEIAEALTHESFESRLPAEDLDEDYEEPLSFCDTDCEEDGEEIEEKAASAVACHDKAAQTISNQEKSDSIEIAKSPEGRMKENREDKNNKESGPAFSRRPLAALIKRRLEDEQPILPWASSNSSLSDLLAARMRKDDKHKSATSKALNDILSIDPKLKSLHAQPEQQRSTQVREEQAQALTDAPREEETFQATGTAPEVQASDIQEPDTQAPDAQAPDVQEPDTQEFAYSAPHGPSDGEPAHEDRSGETETFISDSRDDTFSDDVNCDDDFEEAVVASNHFVISALADEDEALTASTDLADEQDAIQADGSAEQSSALTAATVAGVAALSATALWDRADKSSPLIDLLNKLPTAIVISAKGNILFASKAALSLLGFETEDALQEMGGMEGLFSGRPGDWLTKTNGRTTLRKQDGSPISVQASISSINWGEEPAAMLLFEETPVAPPSIGVSEEDEKIAELEAILDTATDGVLVLDREGRILRMNHSAEALFEVDRHKVAGELFVSLLAEESHKDALAYLERLRNNGLASVLNGGQDVIGQLRSGGLIPLVMTMGRVSIPGTSRFCAVLRDVTEWKHTQEELLAEKLRAEDASKKKSEFLAKVSHEIRTPLNAIIGFSEVMMEERFGAIGPERYKDYLKDIKLSGTHIMSLLNDLLDLAKVEAGKMELQFEAVGLNGLVAECVGIMQPQANRSQIIIRTSAASKLPDVVADTRSLRQIILNILSNAVKFNHAGGQVIVSTTQQENGEVILRIRDTGIGMSREDMKRALEPFRQISPTTRSSAEGSGLGLPLTKALTEANRARLTLSSEKGHGTLVEVVFPLERVIEEQTEEKLEAETAS